MRWTSDGKRGPRNLGGEVVPALVARGRAVCLSFQDYWADVGTVQAYWEANMALLAETPAAGPVRPRLGDPHAQRGDGRRL